MIFWPLTWSRRNESRDKKVYIRSETPQLACLCALTIRFRNKSSTLFLQICRWQLFGNEPSRESLDSLNKGWVCLAYNHGGDGVAKWASKGAIGPIHILLPSPGRCIVRNSISISFGKVYSVKILVHLSHPYFWVKSFNLSFKIFNIEYLSGGLEDVFHLWATRCCWKVHQL